MNAHEEAANEIVQELEESLKKSPRERIQAFCEGWPELREKLEFLKDLRITGPKVDIIISGIIRVGNTICRQS